MDPLCWSRSRSRRRLRDHGLRRGHGRHSRKKSKPDQAVVTADRSDSRRSSARRLPQAVLQVVDGQFLPSRLLVDPGTVVRVENRDRIYHNAFSVASDAPFDVGGNRARKVGHGAP
jgi:plastocyanin